MNTHDQVPIGFHPRGREMEALNREAVLRVAERHFTTAELSELLAGMASGRVDVRIYDDAIVLMRDHVRDPSVLSR